MTTAGYGSGSTPLLIFGGGYDTCEDSDPHTCNATGYTSKGKYVYVVRADTGAVVKAFDTLQNRGVVADITLVRDASGKVILAYTADLGGNVYRIQFGDGTTSSDNSTTWSITRIATLGCDDVSTTCTANRKFMFAPSVVTSDTISLNATYSLLLGSGDREKPVRDYTNAYGVTNYFFNITDKPGVSGYPASNANCSNQAIICLASLTPLALASTSGATSAQLLTTNGWYRSLPTHAQVVTSAVTIFGSTSFSTHTPMAASTTACRSNLGDTLLWKLDSSTGAAVNSTLYSDVAGDGLPPSPVAGQVTLDDGTTVPFCVGCSANSPLEAALPTSASSVSQSKGRLYWYLQK
jgi:type IV pilus assembly protein PilY1